MVKKSWVLYRFLVKLLLCLENRDKSHENSGSRCLNYFLSVLPNYILCYIFLNLKEVKFEVILIVLEPMIPNLLSYLSAWTVVSYSNFKLTKAEIQVSVVLYPDDPLSKLLGCVNCGAYYPRKVYIGKSQKRNLGFCCCCYLILF